MRMKTRNKQQITTFICPFDWSLKSMETSGMEPSCFGGNVYIRRYRVTAELIDEPKEILIGRLQKLWEECDDHPLYRNPLQKTALELGIELDNKTMGARSKTCRKKVTSFLNPYGER